MAIIIGRSPSRARPVRLAVSSATAAAPGPNDRAARRAIHLSKWTRPASPAPKHTANTAPLPATEPYRCSLSAASIGAQAWSRTSHSRKIKMPVAVALSIARVLGIGLRSLPTGKPRKIVNPAIAPSRAI